MNNRSNIRSSINTDKGRYSSKYPLSGLLVCSECGGKFRRFGRTLASGEYVPTWVCVNHQKDSTKCHMLPLKEEDINNTYLKMISELVNTKGVKETIKESIKSILDMNEITDIEKYENELRNNQSKVIKLFKLKKLNEITDDEYKTKFEEYSNIIKNIEVEIKNVKVNNLKVKEAQQRLNSIIEFLDSDEVKLDDPVIMKRLIKQIKVINKHTLEFEMVFEILK